jgi:hypothetical protein
MRDKKEIAAVSAVLACIKEEEDAVCAMVNQREYSQRALHRGLQLQMNIWGVAGRQAQMQLHSLMLAKAYHGYHH